MKKILTIMLAAALAISMAACGGAKEAATEVVESTESVVEEATEEVSEAAEAVESTVSEAAEAVAGALPDLDGFAKTEANGTTIYANTDNTQIISVTKMPSNPELADAFASKNEELLSQLTAGFQATMPDSEPEASFESIGGKDAYVVKINVAKDEAAGIAQDMISSNYYITTESDLVVISAVVADASVDLTDAVTQVVGAL